MTVHLNCDIVMPKVTFVADQLPGTFLELLAAAVDVDAGPNRVGAEWI